MNPHGQPIRWPDGARIAVTFSCLLEAWSEGFSPPTIPPGRKAYFEGTDKALPKPNLLQVDWYAYGGRCGVWRFLDLFEKHGVKASWYVNGRAAELYPEATREIARRGNEVVGHSYAQDIVSYQLDKDAETAMIRRCTQILEEISGYRPVGWLWPFMYPTQHTARILVNEGYIWHGDYEGWDMPFPIKIDGKTIIAIPYKFGDLNDLLINILTQQPASAWLDQFKTTFDFLYEEGRMSPKMFHATVHSHIFGRPYGAALVDKALQYVKSFPNVWVATRAEIAKWYLDNYVD